MATELEVVEAKPTNYRIRLSFEDLLSPEPFSVTQMNTFFAAEVSHLEEKIYRETPPVHDEQQEAFDKYKAGEARIIQLLRNIRDDTTGQKQSEYLETRAKQMAKTATALEESLQGEKSVSRALIYSRSSHAAQQSIFALETQDVLSLKEKSQILKDRSNIYRGVSSGIYLRNGNLQTNNGKVKVKSV